MKLNLMTIFFLLQIVLPNAQYGQNISSTDSVETLQKSLYETALLQVENLLLQQNSHDSLNQLLIDDAQNFAEEGNWASALEILNTILDLYQPMGKEDSSDFLGSDENDDTGIYTTEMSNPASTSRFFVETGVDYSIQEFELSFSEDDSILTEELQNPYVSITYFQPLRIINQFLSLNHRFRFDNQFMNYSLSGTLENRLPNRVSRLEFDGDFFHTQTTDESDFWEGRLSYFFGNPANFKNRWYVDSWVRYKGYPNPDSLNSDIFSVAMMAYYEHFFNFSNSLYLSWQPNFYQANRNSGHQYFRNRLAGFYRLRSGYNKFWEIGIENIYHDFSDELDESDEYKNQYLHLEPQTEFEWPFLSWWGVSARLSYEYRHFAQSDAINPDFSNVQVEGIQKIYWGDLNSFGLGYSWENQVHRVEETEDQAFAQQENFFTHGIIFTAEYIQLSGMMVSFQYSISWRTYPNAEVTAVSSSFYSNRLIHSLSMFGWIPITKHWQIQFFANYDNDQDRDFEHNDTRNTLLNLGILYEF